MIFYIIPYIISLLPVLTYNLKINKYRSFFLLSLVPAFFIATFRGLTGTDTATYLNIIQNIRDEGLNVTHLSEPGFYILAYTLNKISPSSSFTLVLITAVFCAIYYKAFSRTNLSIFISCSLVFPIFFFDMSMNGIRYGFAFCLAIIALNNFGSKIIFYPLLLTSLSFHLTSILIIIFFFIKKIQEKKIKYSRILPLAIITGILIFSSIDYISTKTNDYLNFSTYNKFSGTSTLIIMILLLNLYTLFFKKEIIFIFFIFIATLAAYAITFYSYAGLRFLSLITFITITSMIYGNENVIRRPIFHFYCFTIGIIGFIFKMRNFSESENLESPFIPYLFIWS